MGEARMTSGISTIHARPESTYTVGHVVGRGQFCCRCLKRIEDCEFVTRIIAFGSLTDLCHQPETRQFHAHIACASAL